MKLKIVAFLGTCIGLIVACQAGGPPLPTRSVLSTFTPAFAAEVIPTQSNTPSPIPPSLTPLPPSRTPRSLPPTWTPEPSFTPPDVTAAPVSVVSRNLSASVSAEMLNIRTGPSGDFGVIAQLTQGQSVPIIGISDNGRWYLVRYNSHSQGWLSADFVSVNGDLASVPNMQPTAITGEQARVVRVIDGDTIDVSINGVQERVRYVGINTPERDESCYQSATNYNSRLVSGKEVLLVKDQTDRDRYGRLLRYIYVGNVLVNRELVREGFAEAVLYSPDGAFFREFSELEQEAARQNLACHATGIFKDGSNTR